MSTKSPSENKKRLIIALTGASGAIYGIRALQALQAADDIETHLVISPSAQCTIAEETDMAVDDIKALAPSVTAHRIILSPSARMRGMSAVDVVAELLEEVPVPGATR